MATVVSTNLIPYPNFETASTGWSLAGSGTVLTLDTAQAHSGAQSLKVVTPGSHSDEGITGSVSYTTPNKSFSGGLWIRTQTVGTPLRFTLRTTSGVTSDLTFDFAGTGGWQYVYQNNNVTGSSGVTAVQLLVRTINTVATTFWIDDAILEEGSVNHGFFDGNTPGSAGYTYAWTGATNASTSTRSTADFPELAIPKPYGEGVANNSKGSLKITYRSGWVS